MGLIRRISLVLLSLFLFYQGWVIYWDAIGPQIRWVETLSVGNTNDLLEDLQSQGMLAKGVNQAAIRDYAISPASDRLRRDFRDAYQNSEIKGLLVMLGAFVILILCCIPFQKPTPAREKKPGPSRDKPVAVFDVRK